MTDQTADQDFGEEIEEGAEPEPARKGGKTKLLLMIGLPVLLLAGVGGGLYATGAVDKALAMVTGSAGEGAKSASVKPSVYYDLPVMLVNLNSSGRQTNFLKIHVSLEVASKKDIEHLKAVQPRIIDNFQVYLRELRIDDLSGSAGLQRLREELLLRVQAAAGQAEVRDVLFKEMLVQ